MSIATKWADVGERSVWTLMQAGIGIEAVNLLGGPAWVGALLASVLAVFKGVLAGRFGNQTAATLPTSREHTPALR